MRSILTRCCLLLLTCVALTGCGSVEGNVNTGDEFDNEELRATLAAEMKKETKTAFKVTCPKDIKMKKGAKFECSAVDPEDHKVKVFATQTDGEGDFDWEIAALFDNEEVVEVVTEGLKEEIDVDFDVTCPKDIEIRKGDTFDCTAIDPDDYEVIVRSTQTDADGTFDWEIVEYYNTEKLEASIAEGLKEQAKIDFTVECPEEVEMAVGADYACVATDPDGEETTIATETTEDGDINWEPVED